MSTRGSVLLNFDFSERQNLVRAGSSTTFALLADGLARELEPLVNAELPIPERKARMTRYGGRCPEHGVFLDFDPWSPHDHWCPRCKRAYQDPKHDDWWAMGAQLWTAERAVHAAALFALRGDVRHGELAARILRAYAKRYDTWPNRDNVLGPSRPFFSTYLESIWLLNLCHALALLEGRFEDWTAGDGDTLRAQLIEPSAALIDSYSESRSNRQVWNEVAISSAWCMLDRESDVRNRFDQEFGIRWQIANGLDEDGAWYEGENYHLFAHRGLWYGVQLMRALGEPLAQSLNERYSKGFVAPFAGVLPDDTFPSRRDSKYAMSIRQWRIAEWCELGWAHTRDRRVAGVLHRIYNQKIPRRTTGRDRSTADAEHNAPPSALTRADLSWRGLLMATADAAPPEITPPGSVLWPTQGLAVIRRDGGRTYVALEGGQLGGGHGHPDQLALTLQTDGARWLEDPGTGSYVEKELTWYRSTLAHAAPLVDRRNQAPVAATLIAFDDNRDFGWIVKRVDGMVDGVQVERSIVVGDGYLIDVLEWRSDKRHVLELPIAGEAELVSPGEGAWRALRKLRRFDDLAPMISNAMCRGIPDNRLELWAQPTFADRSGDEESASLRASDSDRARAHVWYALDASTGQDDCRVALLKATVPAAPWHGTIERHWIRAIRTSGRIVGVWSWPTDNSPSGVVTNAVLTPDAMPCVRVTTASGRIETHSRTDAGWRIDVNERRAGSSVLLGGFRHQKSAEMVHPMVAQAVPRAEYVLAVAEESSEAMVAGSLIPHATTIELGEPHYVRTDQSWIDAGAPAATVQLFATERFFGFDVYARTGQVVTDVPGPQDQLDNEDRYVNADGLQYYMARADVAPNSSREWFSAGLLVPGEGEHEDRRSPPIAGTDLSPRVSVNHAADGWAMRVSWERAVLPLDVNGAMLFELVINERPPDRERRRGQLALSGGGGFGYLAGSRRPTDRFVRVVLPPATKWPHTRDQYDVSMTLGDYLE